MASSPNKRGSTVLRIVVGAFLVLVVIAVIGIVFLPSLLGTSLGLAIVNAAINTNPQTRIDVQQLDLSWSGTQRIPKLVVDHRNGEVQADLAIELNGSLIAWGLRGVRDFGTVSIDGDVVVREPQKREQPTDSPAPSTPPGEAIENIMVPENWNATLDFQSLNVRYESRAGATDDARTSIGKIEIHDLIGTLALNSSGDGRIEWSLNGESVVNDQPGAIETTGTLTKFIGDANHLAPQDATASAKIDASVVPVRLIDGLAGQQGRLLATIGETLNIRANLNGNMTQGKGDLSIDSAKTNGSVSITFDGSRIAIDEPARIEAQVDPQTFRAFQMNANLDELMRDAAGRLTLELPSLSLELNDQNAIDLSTLRTRASLSGQLTGLRPNVQSINALEVTSVRINLSTDDPTSEILLDAESVLNVHAANQSKSTIKAGSNLSLESAFAPDGTFRRDAAIVSGRFTSNDIDTSIVDGLANLDGLLVDALGPVIQAFAVTIEPTSLPGEDTLKSSGAMDFGVAMRSANARVDWPLRFDFQNGLVHESDELTEVARLQPTPALVARLQSYTEPGNGDNANTSSKKLRLDEIGAITLNVKHLRYPLVSGLADNQPTSTSAMDDASFEGRLRIDRVNAQIPELARTESAESQMKTKLVPLRLDFVRVDVQSNRLAEGIGMHLHAVGSGELGEFSIGAPFDITQPLTSDGRLVKATLNANGFDDSSIQAEFTLNESAAEARFASSGRFNLSPEFADRLAALTANTSLVERAMIDYTIEPITLRRASPDEPFEWTRLVSDASARMKVNADRIFVKLPKDAAGTRAARRIDLHNVSINAGWPSGLANGYPAVTLSADWLAPEVNNRIASLAASTDASTETLGRVNVELTEVDVARAEIALGLESGRLSSWVGKSGSAILAANVPALLADSTERGDTPDADALVARVNFDRLQGELRGRLEDESLVIDDESYADLRIEHDTAAQLLNRPATDASNDDIKSANEKPQERIEFGNDVNLRADINLLRIPRSILTRDSQDYSAIDLDSDLSMGDVPVTINRMIGRVDQFTIRNLTGFARQTSGSKGVEFELVGDITDRRHWSTQLQQQLGGGPSGGDAESLGGSIFLTGTFVPASSTEQHWRFANLEADLARVPVSLIDAYAHARGVLAATVGRDLSAALRAEDFGPDAGFATVIMQTANGSLSIDSLRLHSTGEVSIGASPTTTTDQQTGRAGQNRYRRLSAAQSPGDSSSLDFASTSWAATASLDVTEEMSHLVLQGINPVLYDVQKKTSPVRLGVNYLCYPLSGDLREFDADVVLDLGQVRVPSSGLLGDLLGTARDKIGESTDATIPPINVKVVDGLLEYDRLLLQTPQFNVATGGSIDLKTQRLDLLAAVPLIGWQAVFGEMTGPLKAPVDNWNIPFYLVVTGTIEAPEIKPDPNGAERVMEDFFKGAIDATLGNIFRQIIDDRDSDNQQKQNKKKKQDDSGSGGG